MGRAFNNLSIYPTVDKNNRERTLYTSPVKYVRNPHVDAPIAARQDASGYADSFRGSQKQVDGYTFFPISEIELKARRDAAAARGEEVEKASAKAFQLKSKADRKAREAKIEEQQAAVEADREKWRHQQGSRGGSQVSESGAPPESFDAMKATNQPRPLHVRETV